MRTIFETFTAGQIKRIQVYASYFRLMEISAGMRATVRILKMGATRTEAVNVDAGYSFKASEFFDSVEIECTSACTVVFAVSDGEGTYDRVAGEVSILGTVPVSAVKATNLSTPAQVTVGTTVTALTALNGDNVAIYFYADATNTEDVCLGNGGVTTANAVIRLKPGDVYIEDVVSGAPWYGIAAAAGQKVNVMRGIRV